VAPAVGLSINDSGALFLNKRHADIFQQQMKLLDDYGANMAKHQVAIAQKGTQSKPFQLGPISNLHKNQRSIATVVIRSLNTC
jgi:hypothetical protein